VVRITDRNSGADEAATVQDSTFRVTIPCTATPDTTIGADCSVNTTAEAVTPGSIVAGKRAIWELGQTEVLDGGADGLASTAPNTVFARQGVFAP
jgi:hypothetical protein